MAIDLHCHSIYSDGSDQPGTIVVLAKRIGLRAVALTDHDTTAGLREFMNAGREQGVLTIPGIELSCEYNGRDIHVLGYGILSGAESLEKRLRAIRQERDSRNERMVRRLNELGYPMEYSEVRAKASGSVVSRVHIAQVLWEKGYVQSREEAFERLIGSDGPAYIPRRSLTMEQGVDWLVELGAKVVLAHPMQYRMDEEAIETLLTEMKRRGAVGVEAIHSGCREEDSGRMRAMAARIGLGYTGGSDYHGQNKPGVYLGQAYNGMMIPDICLETLGMNGNI